MGETLAETRLEIESKRTELERTTAQLRDALDVRKRFQENPALVIGIGAGAAFLLVGGPMRVARLVRRQFFPSSPEKAYDSLPRPMQAWVDHMAGAVGPRASDAREALSEELVRWRHDPRKHGKISKKLAQQIAEGPPGPQRAAWSAVEAGAAIVVAALARKAVVRFLSGEAPPVEAPDAAPAAVTDAKPDPKPSSAKDAKAEKAEYSGMSSRAP